MSRWADSSSEDEEDTSAFGLNSEVHSSKEDLNRGELLLYCSREGLLENGKSMSKLNGVSTTERTLQKPKLDIRGKETPSNGKILLKKKIEREQHAPLSSVCQGNATSLRARAKQKDEFEPKNKSSGGKNVEKPFNRLNKKQGRQRSKINENNNERLVKTADLNAELDKKTETKKFNQLSSLRARSKQANQPSIPKKHTDKKKNGSKKVNKPRSTVKNYEVGSTKVSFIAPDV